MVMTSAWVAEPMTVENGREGRTLATLAFALGVWATVLGVLNILYGIGGSGEHKLKVVWAAYLSVGQLYPCLLYTSPSPRDQRGSRMPSSA